LLVLALIALGVTGIELSSPEPAVAGVTRRSSTVVARATPGGELAFMALEPNGTLVVTDRRRKTIQRFDPAGRSISEWGPVLPPAGQLGELAGVAVGPDGHYWVVDRDNARLIRIDQRGQVLATLNLRQLDMYGPNGLSVDAQGRLFLSDTGRNRVLVLDQSGRVLRPLGAEGAGAGQLKQPMQVALSAAGVFVADWENGRVGRWSADFSNFSAWSAGVKPYGIAADLAGRVYVPDSDNRRVRVFSASGASLGDITGPNNQALEVLAPRSLAMDASGALYVMGSDGVVKIELVETATRVSSGPNFDVTTLGAGLLVGGIAALTWWRRRHPSRAEPAAD
jgi:DNA-binding beta-propeller fold protein YncE